MGLLTTYSAANRVVDSDTPVTYKVNAIVYEMWHAAYEVHRYKTKSYKYVGMDFATAQQCAATAAAYYQRVKHTYQLDDSGTWKTHQSCPCNMADITIERVDGDMYDVVINVNEDDVYMSTGGDLSDLGALFDANNRKYDTDDKAFVL